MKKILLILLLFIISKSVFSQADDAIIFLNPPKVAIPGSNITVFIKLPKGLLSDSTKSVFKIPEGWSIISKKFLKEPSLNDQRLIYTISIPKYEKAQEFKLIFELINQLRVTQSFTHELKIKKIRKIEVSVLTHPDFVYEGDTLKTEFLIQNSGNSDEILLLSSKIAKITHTSDSVELKPNESFRVSLINKIQVDPQQNSWNTSVDLSIKMKDSAQAIYKGINIPVYSLKNKKTDPYLRFPIEVGFWYNSITNRGITRKGFQFDIKGAGFLDFKNKHHLFFLIHGPNQITLPGVGSYDQYTLEYQYKKEISLSLGDYTLQFNNLMEFGRFGRGIKYEHDFKKTGFNVFFLTPRFFPQQRETFGGRYKLFISPKYQLSFDALSKKTSIKDQFFRANFIGVSSKFKSEKIFHESELSISEARNKFDFGMLSRFAISLKKMSIGSDFMYTGKNYFGFFNNSWLATNSINYTLNYRISVGVMSSFIRVNPSFDLSTFNTSPFSTTNLAFITYSFNKRNRLMLNYTFQTKEDRLEPKTFKFRENFARLGLNINNEKFNFLFDTRYGDAENLLAQTDIKRKNFFTATSLKPEVRVFPWAWIGGYFEYQRTSKFSNTNSLQDLLFYGGSLRLNYKQFISTNISYRNNYAPDELVQLRSFMDASINVNLKRHSLSFIGGKAFIPNFENTFQNTLFFIVKYSFKINAPIAKNRNLGNISGNLLGLNGLDNFEGILLHLGDKKFKLDSTGKFYFNNLIPDRYYLTLEPPINQDRVVSSLKSPLEIIVKSDSTKNIVIPVTKTGGIFGKVDFVFSKEIGNVANQKPQVLIKLIGEKESYLTELNKDDSFTFKEIKPGKWKVIVSVQSKKEQFSIENGEVEVEIQPLSEKRVTSTIRQIERKIHFSSNNFNLISKNENPKKEENKNGQIYLEQVQKKDSLKSVSELKQNQDKMSEKIIKTVQWPASKKTFDKISIGKLKNKKRVVIKTNLTSKKVKETLAAKVQFKFSSNLISKNLSESTNGNSPEKEINNELLPKASIIRESEIERTYYFKNKEKLKK